METPTELVESLNKINKYIWSTLVRRLTVLQPVLQVSAEKQGLKQPVGGGQHAGETQLGEAQGGRLRAAAAE